MRLPSGENVDFLIEHPIIQKHISLIEHLANDRVFAIFYGEYGVSDKFYIEECCDNWYSHVLTTEDCKELAELFSEIANELEKNNE